MGVMREDRDIASPKAGVGRSNRLRDAKNSTKTF